MNGGISEEVRTFVVEHIDSVEQLEVLLLIRASAKRTWTAEGVASELRIDPRSAGQRLEDLRKAGLVAPAEGGGVCFSPRSQSLARVVEELAQSYHTHRVSVISLIFSKPSERIRSFSDAFRLRREDPDG
ncbi:hypothetical protein [Vulgatibacter sp.]|uniref:hypothetical protein n=1 Tax=Vulgatibacter sp. TaxID=1971226 RepID=UPI00356977FE